MSAGSRLSSFQATVQVYTPFHSGRKGFPGVSPQSRNGNCVKMIAVAEETWLPVVSFDGIYAASYQVSDHGQVQSTPRHRRGRQGSTRKVKGRILSPRIRDNGTRAVNLWHDNEYHQVPVKILILEAFICPAPPYHEAKCVDGNEANLALSNLAWKPAGGLAVLHQRLGR